MKTDEFIISLQAVVRRFGLSVLNDSKLVNILLDYGGFATKTFAKSVMRELVIEGYLSKIIQLDDNSDKINSLVYIIVSQTGFSKQAVEYVVNCILYSLGRIHLIPKYTIDNTKIHSVEDAPNPIVNKSFVLNGEYTEKLLTGGDLKISRDKWSVDYYFSGPDNRYNGIFKVINGIEINKYIKAWKNNFAKYLELKRLIPSGGNSDYPGEMGMSIRFGFAEGVCLTSYHMPIRTKDKLQEVIKDYENAKLKVVQIQQFLNGSHQLKK